MLDTGALTVISKKLAGKLNIKNEVTVKAIDVNGMTQDHNLVKLKSLKINNIEINNIAAGVFDLSMFDQYGLNIDGIIGSNALRFFRITIDYEKNYIHFSNNRNVSFESKNAYQLAFEQDITNGFAPKLPCLINDNLTLDAYIDTGFFGYALLPYDYIKKINISENNLVTSIGNISGGLFKDKNEKVALARLKSIKLNSSIKPMSLSNPIVHFNKRTNPLMANRVYLGKDFLIDFLVIIDYLNNKLILMPKNKLSEEKQQIGIFSFGLKIQPNEGLLRNE